MSGDHLWAERFDRSLEDIFAVQDEVTGKIVEALLGRLRAPPPRNRPKNLEAYDLCVRARKLMDDSPQTAREAHLMLTRAVSLDPEYAEAYRWLAMNHWMGWVHSGGPTEPTRSVALELARKAVAIDPNDAGCRWVLAYLLAYERSFAEADAEFAKAIELDPNEADAWAALSDIAVLAGRVEEGLEHIRKAFRLNPFPASWYYLTLGQAQYAAPRLRSRRRDTAQGRDLSHKLTPLPGGKPCATRPARRGARGGRAVPRRQPAFHDPPLGGDGAIPRRRDARAFRRWLPQGRSSGVTRGCNPSNRSRTPPQFNVALARFTQDGRMNVDHPSAAFGRLGRESRAPAALADRAAKPARAIGQIAYLFGLTGLLLAVVGAIFWTLPGIEKLNAETTQAEQRVVEIVNQPITHLPRAGPVELFSPGWFHAGAMKPDFDNVDIRATQEFPYDGNVTSDVNPSEMFIGSELEFNAMTKYFYADLTLPKKRLSSAEMIKINGLYRVIGQGEQALLTRWLTIAGLVVVGICLGSALFLLVALRPRG